MPREPATTPHAVDMPPDDDKAGAAARLLDGKAASLFKTQAAATLPAPQGCTFRCYASVCAATLPNGGAAQWVQLMLEKCWTKAFPLRLHTRCV